MIFTETRLKGAYVIDVERLSDERGFFARTWCRSEFDEHGLNSDLVQCSLAFNTRAATLRGMHYQAEPHAEVKVIRCTRGSIYDVIVDLRPGSPTFREWTAIELTADNRRMLYVPEGFAHGYQTLLGDSEVFYQMSRSYVPGAARGFRWNDPAFAIDWPEGRRTISSRDLEYPDFEA